MARELAPNGIDINHSTAPQCVHDFIEVHLQQASPEIFKSDNAPTTTTARHYHLHGQVYLVLAMAPGIDLAIHLHSDTPCIPRAELPQNYRELEKQHDEAPSHSGWFDEMLLFELWAEIEGITQLYTMHPERPVTIHITRQAIPVGIFHPYRVDIGCAIRPECMGLDNKRMNDLMRSYHARNTITLIGDMGCFLHDFFQNVLGVVYGSEIIRSPLFDYT